MKRSLSCQDLFLLGVLRKPLVLEARDLQGGPSRKQEVPELSWKRGLAQRLLSWGFSEEFCLSA